MGNGASLYVVIKRSKFPPSRHALWRSLQRELGTYKLMIHAPHYGLDGLTHHFVKPNTLCDSRGRHQCLIQFGIGVSGLSILKSLFRNGWDPEKHTTKRPLRCDIFS